MDFFGNLRNMFFGGGNQGSQQPQQQGPQQFAGPVPQGASESAFRNFGVTAYPNSGGGGGGGPVQGPQQPQQQQQQGPSGPSSDALGAIDSLYNNTISQIGGIQSNLQGEQSSEIGKVQQGQQSTQSALKQSQTARQAGITGRRGQAQDQERSSLEQLRQTYGDLQSQQTAQLSAAGISSSSAAEALGVYLTRDQAQRVAGVVQQTGDTMGALDDEVKSVNDWYTQSTTELQQDTQSKVDQINRDFSSRIGQLDQIRGQSAVARQQQRGELFNQYQQQLSDMQNYASQAAYSLQSWQQQQTQNLSSARSGLMNISQVQAQVGAGGNVTGLTPIMDAQGNFTGQYSGGKTSFLANNAPFQSQPGQSPLQQPLQQLGSGVGTTNNSSRFYQTQ